MSLTFTYDPATDIGKVRLAIDDRDMSAANDTLPLEKRSVIFADEEVQVFIDDAGGDRDRAAARALRAVATNRSLLVQRRRINKTDVDYGDIRRDLLAMATALENQSNTVPADGFAEIGYDDFTLRRIVVNEQLRKDGLG